MRSPTLRVLKVGGARLADARYVDELTHHLKQLTAASTRVILVHGGGREIGEFHEALGIPTRKELGLRITSEAGMDLVTMVLCGLVNKRLVAHLNCSGVRALGVCGADLGVLRTDFLNEAQLGRVGGPPRINVETLRQLHTAAEVLAIAPVCLGPDATLLNVNADVVAQAIAVALHVEQLDFVTDVAAVRTRTGAARHLSPGHIEELVRTSVVDGGMIPKLQASLAALDGGVARVRVGNLESLTQGTATEVHA